MRIYGTENNYFILKELGTRLKDTRIRSAITQEDLSTRTGVSVSTIRRIEDGTNANLDNLMRVMREFRLLENFQFLIPEQDIRPEDMLRETPKRQRVSRKAATKTSEWKWGDEET